MSMDAPSPPDPVATANAQETLNKNTAIYQAEMNNVNQTTPYGSLTYTQTGTNPDGTPIFSARAEKPPAASTALPIPVVLLVSGMVSADISDFPHA